MYQDTHTHTCTETYVYTHTHTLCYHVLLEIGV